MSAEIMRDPELTGRGIAGYMASGVTTIQVYADAFMNPEQWVRMLTPERIHIMPIQLYGPPADFVELGLNEQLRRLQRRRCGVLACWGRR